MKKDIANVTQSSSNIEACFVITSHGALDIPNQTYAQESWPCAKAMGKVLRGTGKDLKS